MNSLTEKTKSLHLKVKHFGLYAVTFKVVASETPVTPTTPATPAAPTTPATPAAPTTSSSSSRSAAQERINQLQRLQQVKQRNITKYRGEDVTPGIIGGILAALGGLGLAIPKKVKETRNERKYRMHWTLLTGPNHLKK